MAVVSTRAVHLPLVSAGTDCNRCSVPTCSRLLCQAYYLTAVKLIEQLPHRRSADRNTFLWAGEALPLVTSPLRPPLPLDGPAHEEKADEDLEDAVERDGEVVQTQVCVELEI